MLHLFQGVFNKKDNQVCRPVLTEEKMKTGFRVRVGTSTRNAYNNKLPIKKKNMLINRHASNRRVPQDLNGFLNKVQNVEEVLLRPEHMTSDYL